MKNNLHLGFYTEGNYFRNNSEVVGDDIFIVFFKKLFPGYKYSTIGRLSNSEISPKYNLGKECIFFPLTYYKSIKHLTMIFPFFVWRNLKTFYSFSSMVDVLFIAASSPLSVLLLYIIKRKSKPILLFIRQNTRELIVLKNKNGFIHRKIAGFIEFSIEHFVKNYNKVTVFTLGEKIFRRYQTLTKRVVQIADSRYKDIDILRAEELSLLDNSSINFLYVGRLAKGKGLSFLLNSFAEIVGTTYTLNIVGDGVLKKDLVNQTKKLNLIDKVNFKGYIPFGEELLKEYSSNDVLILPSFSEGLPQVVLEAMARGVIVVATRVGGLNNLIKDGENGFLFEPGDKKGLLKIIREIQMNELPLLAIRKNGINTAKKYSFEKQATKIYKVLDQIDKQHQMELNF